MGLLGGSLLVPLKFIVFRVLLGPRRSQCSRCGPAIVSFPRLAGWVLADPLQFSFRIHCCKCPLLIHVLLALHLCRGAGSPDSCPPVCTGATDFSGQSTGLCPCCITCNSCQWILPSLCPQVSKSFLPKYSVILKLMPFVFTFCCWGKILDA